MPLLQGTPGPSKDLGVSPVDHRHAPVFDPSHDLLVSALARIVPSSVLSAPQAASDGLIWPRVGFASIAFPQPRLEIFSPCATSWCGARIPRETTKSPARRPSLALQPQAVRFDRSSAVIAIEAAMGAVRYQRRRRSWLSSATSPG